MKYTAFGSGLLPLILQASLTAPEVLSACFGGVLESIV